jgi:hypothetical protein
MTEGILFWSTYVALWLTVATLFISVFVLYRHLGMQLLNTREQRMNQGPSVGERFPIRHLVDVDGKAVDLSLGHRPVLMFLASTACRPCADAREALATFAVSSAREIETLLICRGATVDDVRNFTDELPREVRVVPDLRWEIGAALKVAGTPFALIVDADRLVRGKGSPTTAEAFEWFREQISLAPPQLLAPSPTTSGSLWPR